MARIVVALLGAALILIESFFLSLKAIDYFGLFSSGPMVSLLADGKESLVVSEVPYTLTYSISRARSCELVWSDANGRAYGQITVQPNTSVTGPSGWIGDYTLTCIGPNGAATSKSAKVRLTPK